jgi:hypothetical protein
VHVVCWLQGTRTAAAQSACRQLCLSMCAGACKAQPTSSGIAGSGLLGEGRLDAGWCLELWLHTQAVLLLHLVCTRVHRVLLWTYCGWLQ